MKPSGWLRWCWDFFVQFLSLSSIHGVNHLAARKRHPVEITIWLTLVLAGMYGAMILSGMTLTRYQDNPTVISMERDRFSWNTSFPGATICPTTKLNDESLEAYVEKHPTKNKKALRDFLISMSNATFDNFEDVTFFDEISPDEYMQLIIKLQFEFRPTVSNSGINGNLYSLEQVVTEMGLCYSYNSKMAVYNSPDYWEQNRWGFEGRNDTFFVNPLDGEVFSNVVNMSTGFQMILHGPYEVADVASKMLSSPNGYFMQVYLTALSLYSTDRAKSLTVNQRKCRFYDESDLKHSPVYSYVLCRMECRQRLARKLCGCIPHFYRKLDGDIVCDVKGLHCLAQYKERLITLKRECTCFPNCDEVNYIVVQVDSREWFLGSNLQWGLKEYPRMRLKRDVIFGLTDVLVYIGGMAGLFFGCSILSFVEIIYYFSLRFFWFFVNYRRSMMLVEEINPKLKSSAKH